MVYNIIYYAPLASTDVSTNARTYNIIYIYMAERIDLLVLDAGVYIANYLNTEYILFTPSADGANTYRERHVVHFQADLYYNTIRHTIIIFSCNSHKRFVFDRDLSEEYNLNLILNKLLTPSNFSVYM